MLVLVGVTSYYQVWWLWLSKSERLYSLCQKIVEYVDGIHHPSPPVDWIWDIYDISNQKCCACTRGFIDCPAANDKFGRDVFIHKAWILRSSWWLFFGTPWFPTDVFVGVMKWRMMWYWIVVFYTLNWDLMENFEKCITWCFRMVTPVPNVYSLEFGEFSKSRWMKLLRIRWGAYNNQPWDHI